MALPFSFRYNGQPFTSVTVSANGFLVFGPSPATAWVNSPLPSTAVPNGVVAAYWDDLNPALGGGSGTAALAQRPTASSSSAGSASATLICRPNQLPGRPRRDEQRDRARLPGHPARKSGPDYGASATIGLESPEVSLGAQFLYNQPLLAPYQATTALRYTNRAAGPPPPPDPTPPAVPIGLQATAGDPQAALDGQTTPTRSPTTASTGTAARSPAPRAARTPTPVSRTASATRTGSPRSTRPATKARHPTRSAPARKPR